MCAATMIPTAQTESTGMHKGIDDQLKLVQLSQHLVLRQLSRIIANDILAGPFTNPRCDRQPAACDVAGRL